MTEVRIPEREMLARDNQVAAGLWVLARLRGAGIPVTGVLFPLGVERGILSVEIDDLATGDTVWTWKE